MARNNKGQRWVQVPETDNQKLDNGIIRRMLAYDDNLMVLEFAFDEAGLQIPTHTHPHTQIIYVIEGALEVTVGDDTRVLRTGDTVLVKSNEPHSVVSIEKGKGLDIFNPMREDFV